MKDYTLKEAAAILHLSPISLRVYIFQKKIKAVKRGRDWFISQDEVDKLLSKKENV